MASIACIPLCIALVLLYKHIRGSFQRRGVSLPPGPPADPLIGHLRAIPRTNKEEAFTKWSKTYGDVVYLNALGRSMVVLNSQKAAIDLLEKRSAIYSDRPPLIMYRMLGWTDVLAFLPYGDKFRKLRELFQNQLSPKVVTIFQETQTNQGNILLKSLLQTPEDFEAHSRRFSSSVVMEVAYGHRIKSNDDYYLGVAERLNDILIGAGEPGATIVDFFPFLRHLPAWFPGAWFVRYAETNRIVVDTMLNYAFDEVRQNLAAGTAEVSFVSTQLEQLAREGKENQVEFDDLKISAVHLYLAGGDTTWSSVQSFILFMLLHPETQRKAQKEIDEIIGPKRLPLFSDRQSLPFVDCVLQETLRWRPAVPLGVPHCIMEDDVYRGMFIPKGTTIIANITSITVDPEVYENPQLFYPERYLSTPAGYGEPFPVVHLVSAVEFVLVVTWLKLVSGSLLLPSWLLLIFSLRKTRTAKIPFPRLLTSQV